MKQDLLNTLTAPLLNMHIPSPLDQFGDDASDSLGVTDFFDGVLGFLPDSSLLDDAIEWSGVGEVDQVESWLAALLANSGLTTFDDDAAGES